MADIAQFSRSSTSPKQPRDFHFHFEEAGCFCGATNTIGAVSCRDELTGDLYTYRRCASCRAERLSPRPTRDVIGGYYPDNYACHNVRSNSLAQRFKRLLVLAFHAPDNRLGWWRPLLRLFLYPLRGHTVFAFRPVEPRRIFEFGAATGNDLALFRADGWEVCGCEPSTRACAIAAERGIMLTNCAAEGVELAHAAFGAVLLNNVLEHTHDPASVVAASWRGLAPGGSLVLVVPNHDGPSPRLFGAAWPGYDAPRHLWGFTPASLCALLQRTGFEPPRVYPMFQGVWAWEGSVDGRRSAVPVPRWRRLCARPLAFLLYPVGVLLAMCGSGDFITVVATKPATIR